MKLNNRSIQIVGVYFIVIISLVLLYFVSNPTAPEMNSDSPAYQDSARDLLDNGQLDEAQIRPIGYAIILILTDSVEVPTRALYLFQLALHAITVSAVMYLLFKFDISHYSYLLFFIFAWLPPSVSAASRVLTETPTAFCLSVGISALLFYLKDGKLFWLILSSILLSLAAWLRPTYQFLPLTIVIFLMIIYFIHYFDDIIYRRFLVSSIVLAVNFFIIVGGYMIFNKVNFGYTGISPLVGYNLTTRTVRFVDKLPDNYAVEREILVKYRNERLIRPNDYPIHTAYMYIWGGAIPDLMEATDLTFVELGHHLLKANLELIIDNPLEYLIEVSHGFVRFWFPAGGLGVEGKLATLIWLIVHYCLVSLYFFSLLILSMAVGAIFVFRNNIRPRVQKFDFRIICISLMFIIILQTWVISTFIEVGFPRYRIPVEMLIYASLFFQISTVKSIYQNIVSFLQSYQL